MTPEEALQIADEVVFAHIGKPLTDLQRMILRESLADKGYEEMEGYETQHIKNEGSNLWKLLSAALGEKVSKTSFRGALEKRLKSGNITPKPPDPFLYDLQTWVGRESLIEDLLSQLHGETRLVWLTGVSGIGKTTLAECLAAKAWDANKPFQWIRVEILDGQSPDFATEAANLLTKMGDKDLDPQERNDPKRLGDRLLWKLQSNRYWIQLDALERLLNSDQPTEFADSYWLTFFQLCLTSIQFQSLLVLTSQALPKKMAVLKDRKFWHWAELKGLLSSECLDLFAKHGISATEENTLTLSKIGQAYEGHPLVLQVIAGEICEDFDGNVTQYWERYGDEFEQVARKLEAKRVDSFLYNQELKERVRERVEESLKQLSSDALDLLCRSAVYRRAVPQTFWQAMLWNHTPKQQQDAYSLLRNRALIEKEGTIKGQDIIRQHNLISDIAYDLLWQDSSTWETAECKAAQMWLTAYEAAPNTNNLEKVRGYLEAFHHYCELRRHDLAFSTLYSRINNYDCDYFLDLCGYDTIRVFLHKQLIQIWKSSNQEEIWQFAFVLTSLGNAYHSLREYIKAIEC
ncbi:MAG: AAA family ATPase [Scytonema hyalinum WJT4-NPBG1]|jgi:hypothetical protein|nr:AAA family ATPase [Scytonema hyalinum WJT4-NPBG1]